MRMRFITFILLLAILPIRAFADGDRLPAPTAADQTTLRLAVRQQFSDLYTSTDPAGELSLARMLWTSSEQADTAGQQFALLCESRDAAARAGDLATAERICTTLVGKFNLTIHTARAGMFKAGAESIAHPDTFFADLLKAIDAALLDDDFVPATQMIETGTTASIASTSAAAAQATQWEKPINIRQHRLETQQKACPAIKPAIDILREDPTDGPSNVIVGEYNCLIKNDWHAGLVLLTHGNDKPLRELAALDLKNPDDAAHQTVIADGWTAMAYRIPAYAEAFRLRAYDWNMRALPFATIPDERTHIESQLTDLAPLVADQRDKTSLWLAIGDSLAHRAYVSSRIAGGSAAPERFQSMPKFGGLLIGFHVGFAMLGDRQVITFLQPIYDSPTGEQDGEEIGKLYSRVQTFRAPAGYAIGAMRSSGSAGLNSITPIFYRLDGDHLNRDDVIKSPRIGQAGGVLEIQDGQGTPIIGICGKRKDGYIGIGLLYSHIVKED